MCCGNGVFRFTGRHTREEGSFFKLLMSAVLPRPNRGTRKVVKLHRQNDVISESPTPKPSIRAAVRNVGPAQDTDDWAYIPDAPVYKHKPPKTIDVRVMNGGPRPPEHIIPPSQVIIEPPPSPPLYISEPLVYELSEEEIVAATKPEYLFVVPDTNTKDVIEQVVRGTNISETERSSSPPSKIVTYNDLIQEAGWRIPTIQMIFLVADNHGSDSSRNRTIASIAEQIVYGSNVACKIAIPRRGGDTDACLFSELISQGKGVSKCARAIRGAVSIGKEDIGRLNEALPLQLILQRLMEERERLAVVSLSKETVAQRLNAAVAMYEKGIEIDCDNIVAVNLWLRGITYIPPSFRAAILTHPDRSKEENKTTTTSQDRWTGLIDASETSDERDLHDRIVHYKGQYWRTTCSVLLPDVITLRLWNPYNTTIISVVGRDKAVEHGLREIQDPNNQVRFRDFRLYTRVIPFHNAEGHFTGVERTFLANNAHQKRNASDTPRIRTKLARGLTNGSSSIFYGSRKPTIKIVGEGSENVLSALEVCRKVPGAARTIGITQDDLCDTNNDDVMYQFASALGVSDLIKMPIEDSVRTIILVVDNDGYNLETKITIMDTIEHWLCKYVVKVVFPLSRKLGQKRDLNDILREEGLDACAKTLTSLIEITDRQQLGPPTEALQTAISRLMNPIRSMEPSLEGHLADLRALYRGADSGARLFVKIGQHYLVRGDLVNAAAYFEKASVATENDNSIVCDALTNLGNIARLNKDYEHSLSCYKRALTHAWGTPTVPQLIEKIGDIHHDMGNTTEANDYYEKAISTLNKVYCSERHKLDLPIRRKIVHAWTASSPSSYKAQARSDTNGQKRSDTDTHAAVDPRTRKTLHLDIVRERLFTKRQIVIDLEMTGGIVEKDRITNIGCVVLDKGKRTGQTFNRYVNPEIHVRSEAHRLTGLTLGYLKRFPVFAIAAPEFLGFIRNADLVLHAAQKDIEFLNRQLEDSGLDYRIADKHYVIDTFEIAQSLYPGQKNNLDALNERLGIYRPRSLHRALIDAEITTDVYLAMLATRELKWARQSSQ